MHPNIAMHQDRLFSACMALEAAMDHCTDATAQWYKLGSHPASCLARQSVYWLADSAGTKGFSADGGFEDISAHAKLRVAAVEQAVKGAATALKEATQQLATAIAALPVFTDPTRAPVVIMRGVWNSPDEAKPFRLALCPRNTNTEARITGHWKDQFLAYRPKDVRALLTAMAALTPDQVACGPRTHPKGKRLSSWDVSFQGRSFWVQADSARNALTFAAGTLHAPLAKPRKTCAVRWGGAPPEHLTFRAR